MVGKKSLISGKSYTFFLISNYELSMKWGIFAYDDDVKALATHVVDVKGRAHDLYSKWRRCTAKIWWYIRPMRRYLLAIYRRTNNIHYI